MNKKKWTVYLIFSVALLGDVCHCWEAYVQGPVKAVRGSCVLVPCNTVTYTNVKWYAYRRMSYPVVYSNDRSEIMDEFKGRTSVPNALNGNCTLKIDNVRQQDSEVDLYVWIWKYGGEDKGFYDRTIKINICEYRHNMLHTLGITTYESSIQNEQIMWSRQIQIVALCYTPNILYMYTHYMAKNMWISHP